MKYVVYIYFVITLVSCRDKDTIPEPVKKNVPVAGTTVTGNFNFYYVPVWFPYIDLPPNNLQSYYIIQLGKQLFYDPVLSADSSISCASCHIQSNAFADNQQLSTGINNRKGTRNAPPLFNLAWQNSFFWDGGVSNLETQAIAPIVNEAEMGHNLFALADRLNADRKYKDLFSLAFNDDSIYTQRIITALAYFEKTLISAGSKYDSYISGNYYPFLFNFTERAGLELVEKKCGPCHSGPLFTDFSFRNNGLDSVFSDLGRGRITLDPTDNGKFKVPTLRNLDFTAPYMHDGRFATLDEVLDHYASPDTNSPNIAPEMRTISLTEKEKKDIIAFLHALSDYNFIKSGAHSKP